MELSIVITILVAIAGFIKWVLDQLEKTHDDLKKDILEKLKQELNNVNSLIFELNTCCNHKTEIMEIKLAQLKETIEHIENYLDGDETLRFKKRRRNED